MLSVVLTILKFIGITILVILGLFLFVLCLVLFVPIRYKADGFYKETYRIQTKISWLLHIVTFALLYEKDQPFHMKLRVFGIPIFDNLKKKEKKVNEKSKKQSKKQTKTVKEEPKPEIIASSIPEEDHTKKGLPQKIEPIQTAIEDVEENEIAEMEKLGMIQKLKTLFVKVIGFFRNIKYTFQRICDTIKTIKNNITYYVELLKKDSTKAAIATCKKQLLRIFKNIKPQKLQVNLHLGMENPATMGDILGVWGMLYPIHQGQIDICPEFEQAVLEGEFYCKGRVTVYIYIWTVFIILFDKDIRRLRKCLVRKGK